MNHRFTTRFIRSYQSFSPTVQKKFDKQLRFLLKNSAYPSLHAKKFDETRGIWQARVDRNVRFYFLIQDNTYVLLSIRHHAK